MRIVKIKNGRLGEGICTAIAERVQWVSLQLGRASIGCRGDERDGSVAGRHRGRVVKKLARNRIFHALGERNEVGFRTAATGESDASKGDRGTHELEEIALREPAIFIHLGSTGEFPLKVFDKLRVILTLTQTAPKRGILFGSWVV